MLLPAPLAAQQIVLLDLTVPQGPLRLGGQVRWIGPLQQSDLGGHFFPHGVRFQNLLSRAMVEQVVTHQLALRKLPKHPRVPVELPVEYAITERVVATSCLNISRGGIYIRTPDPPRLNREIEPYDRQHAINPILNCFQAADGRWFWLLLLQADRHWPDLCRAIQRPDLRDDPRFADIASRRKHALELVEELDQVFAAKALAQWAEIFDREDVWWAPVNTVNDVVQDSVAQEAGVFVDVPAADEGTIRMVASPADFYGTPWRPRASRCRRSWAAPSPTSAASRTRGWSAPPA
jgi:hypothetical protein